ncbi:MAG: hypothetical protein ACK559_06935, partial [bacterium]
MRDAEDAHLGRRSSTEREFGGSIQRLVAVSEAYPQLKADEVTYYLNYTRAKVLVTDAATVPTVDAVRG